MNEIWAVIVIYNTKCPDSVTCRSLLDEKKKNVLVVDNSTSDMGNDCFCRAHGWDYISMGGNKGIAKAYNCALRRLKETAGTIVWLDDDTQINSSYFTKLNDALEQYKEYSIFLPIVNSEIGIMSPCFIKNQLVRPIKDIRKLSQETITGINAGMAVRAEIYRDYRYDERYMVDYVDHAFLRDMKQRNIKIKIIDAQLTQSFSGRTDNKENSIIRFKIFKSDFRLFCSQRPADIFAYYYTVLRRKAYLTIHFKDITILAK